MTDRPVDQGCGHRRIHAATERADHPGRSNLGPDLGDLLVDDPIHRPCRRGTGEVEHEAAEHVLAVGGMDHLGVELNRPHPPVVTLERGGWCVGRRSRRGETRRHLGDRVEVAHPHVLGCGQVSQQGRAAIGDSEVGASVLAAHAPPDGAAELLGDELGAVADPQGGDAQVIDGRVEDRGPLDVHALRAATQHQGSRRVGGQLGGGYAVRHDL